MHHSIPPITTQESLPSSHSEMSPILEELPYLTSSSVTHRASRVEEWIGAQHSDGGETITRKGQPPQSQNPAYSTSLHSLPTEDADFVLVDEQPHSITQDPDTPSTPPQSSKQASSIFNAPSPLRNFRFSLSSTRRPASLSTGGHSRGASLSTLPIPRTSSPMIPDSPRLPQSPWNVTSKFRRRSVLGHFTPDVEESLELEPPRPSFSSNGSYSTRPSIDSPSSVPTIFSYSSNHKSSPSLWSLPSTASHMNDPPGSTKLVSQESRSTIRVPFSKRSSGTFGSDHSPSILSTTRSRKKKYLVVSGIAMNDDDRFDAAKAWCESFGELKNITRVQNGDIHVDFRLAEVADTVCRVQARVSIAGVGSVCLSWYTGKRI